MTRTLNFLSHVHRLSHQILLSTGPRLAGVLLAVAGWSLADAPASAQVTGEVTTLRSFNGVNGEYPVYGLTLGSDGNFYGTADSGGTNNAGTVFRVAPDGTVTLLHSFSGSGDGSYPQCSLILASDGNFYGTTTGGGSSNGNDTVFMITPSGTLTVLHTFSSSDTANGSQPIGGVTQGRDGSLYGTTGEGGDSSGDGTIFQLSLDGTFTTLHTFDFHLTGTGPYNAGSPPIQGTDGNFYGVAGGGDNGVGAVYQMTPDGTVTTIHSFAKTDGSGPVGPLVESGSGVFYGTTYSGGGSSGNADGTIFKVTSTGQFTTLHVFNGEEGSSPQAGLVHGTDGNFYGATQSGGASGAGVLFQCTPDGTLTDLYSFSSGSSAVGYAPSGTLAQAADGSFYGMTEYGGTSGYGTVYRLSVTPHPPFFNGEADLANGVEYLQFSAGNYFGYFSYLTDPHYIYHFDLGYEYVFDAADGYNGVYLYDFKSSDFFYTSPVFPFPYLYDFNLNTFLYYYPDPSKAGHYNTKGVRYFYDFATGKIISK